MDFDFDMNKDFVFTSDKDGVLRGGGFTIHSELLKDTIYGSEPSNGVQSGGKKNNERELLNTFKDLAIPAGLFSMPNNPTQKNKNIRYEHSEKENVLDDGLYDKLLSMLEPSKRKLHGMKTRRKRESSKNSKNKKSRRQK
jgi:hypothetical protein